MPAWLSLPLPPHPRQSIFNRTARYLRGYPNRGPMQPSHSHYQLSEVIMLPVLLIVALAAWTATFLTGRAAQH